MCEYLVMTTLCRLWPLFYKIRVNIFRNHSFSLPLMWFINLWIREIDKNVISEINFYFKNASKQINFIKLTISSFIYRKEYKFINEAKHELICTLFTSIESENFNKVDIYWSNQCQFYWNISENKIVFYFAINGSVHPLLTGRKFYYHGNLALH